MQTASWIALCSGVVSVVVTIILFLVGRLLNANKEMVDALRDNLRDQALQNERAFRDLFSCIDALRSKIGAVDMRIVRLEEARRVEERMEEQGREMFGG